VLIGGAGILEKLKYLIKNMGFIALSSFGIKLISFFLIPLYTSVLTASEYGTYDLFNTTVSLLIPFLTLNIKESTIRFALSGECDKKDVFSIGLKYCFISVICFAGFVVINYFFDILQTMNDYKWLVLLLYISQTIQGFITNFVRGLDRLKDIAISSCMCSVIMIFLNIIMLIPLQMGLRGYFISNVIGPLVQSIYLFIRCKAWMFISLGGISKNVQKEMVTYSAPMIANSTAWWINSVSDRYVIIWLCGAAENGIYSVANKIPSIVDVFQGIFSQAWTLSAVKEFDPDDKSGFFSNMYFMYNMCMTIMSSGLILISRLLSRFLYSNDFYFAWRYVSFLTIAVLFGALAGYCGAIFSAVKASKTFAYSTIAGAIVNVFLNIILVKSIGPLGAAIATAISYAVIYYLRLVNVRKYIKLRIRVIRDWCGYLILVFQSVFFLIFKEECWQLYVIQIILFIVLLSLFKEQYYILARKFVEIINRKKREVNRE